MEKQRQTFEFEQTRKEKGLLEESFFDYFQSIGFYKTQEINPYPSPDKTVVFVGAQISVWKPDLEAVSNKEIAPLVSPQNCIRLQNLDNFFNSMPIEYCSYFRALGALTCSADFGQLSENAGLYLEKAGIEKERIFMKVASDQADRVTKNYKMLVDTEPDSFYNWRYGEEGLSGRGITFTIEDSMTHSIKDIGNVILISKDNKELVSEWGFGLETLLNAKYGGGHPILFSEVPNGHQDYLANDVGRKYIDSLFTSLRIAELGIEPSERGAGFFLTQYIRAVAHLGKSNNLHLYHIIRDTVEMSESINISEETVQIVKDELETQFGKISYKNSRDKSRN